MDAKANDGEASRATTHRVGPKLVVALRRASRVALEVHERRQLADNRVPVTVRGAVIAPRGCAIQHVASFPCHLTSKRVI